MSGAGSALADLFPDGDYRFHLTLRRGDPAEFYRPQDPTGQVRSERARWIAAEPDRYAALRPEGAPLLAEFRPLAVEWGALDHSFAHAVSDGPSRSGIESIGAALEPDVLFLSADADGRFRLRGGALCFPTGWALEEKIGLDLEFIHGVVPGLNAALAAPIHQVLSKLKPGGALLRDNWGLTASTELNLHPARRIRRPMPPVMLDQLWLRVEHQALVAMPRTGGIVFGIRIALQRLDEVARGPFGAGFRRLLETMPKEMIAYKGLGEVHTQIMGML